MVLLGAAGLVVTQAKQANDFNVFIAVVLGVSALVVWLVGKALRYILSWSHRDASDRSCVISGAPSGSHAHHLGPFGWRINTPAMGIALVAALTPRLP